MPRSLLTRLAIAVATALVIAPPAMATQVVHLDTRGLAHESSDIVIGTVTAQTPHWNAAHTMILTDVTLQVTERLKGAPAGTLTLTQIGGEVDGMRYSVAGSPAFQLGEEVLVFAWRDASGRAQVDGLAQGKFVIQRDPVTGVKAVQRQSAGLGVGDARTLRPAPGRAMRAVALDDMKREIQAALAEAGR
jgi:hypothetical protein